jgi:spermidine synthase
MDELWASARREQAVRALLPLFFASGATALVYQTLWARQLHLVFGTSSFAISAVLTAFMAGLAIGGAIMAKRADRAARPLLIYGLLEIGIGVYAFLFPWIVEGISPVYLAAWRVLEPPPVLFGAMQLGLLGLALLAPTTAMGATLPLLARFATSRLGAVGDRVGMLYGVNTAGAVAGTWLCGFVLLPGWGLGLTTDVTAAANVALGLLAIALDAWSRGTDAPVTEDLATDTFRPALRPVALALGLAGFASLIYEVAWTRVLVLMLGASVYAFSVMLLAFLVGIAGGGAIGGRIADRVAAKHGQDGVRAVLAGVEVAIAVLSVSVMFAFQEMPFLYVRLYDLFQAQNDSSIVWMVSLVLAGLVMTPPAVLMGAAFPLAVRAVVHEKDALGGPVGAVYAANTLGSVLGAGLSGFLLLPVFGVRATIATAAIINVLAAAVALSGGRAKAAPRAAMAGLGALPLVIVGAVMLVPWNPLLITAGMYKYVSEFEDHSRAGIMEYAVDAYELMFYEEGLSSVVTVARNKDTGSIWLANNGKVDASTNVDMPTQVLVALLPFQFVDSVDDVLIIGLASGITAGAAGRVSGIQNLDVVELEPATQRAARLFDDHNHHILDDPRVSLISNDGRNHVLLSPEQSYDVIVSEPSNPWISGVSNLFTKEFLEIGKKRLKPGGAWAQWVQLYGMDREDLRALLGTFADVYPHVVLFTTIEDADIVLVGSESPLDVDEATAARFLQRWPEAEQELRVVRLERPMDLVGTYLMDRDQILAMTEGVERNTDDNMRIEYGAPRHLHQSTAARNVELLLKNAQIPPSIRGDALALARMAAVYEERDDRDRARSAMATAVDLELAARGHEAGRALLASQLQLDDAVGIQAVIDEAMRALAASEAPPIELLDAFDDWKKLQAP